VYAFYNLSQLPKKKKVLFIDTQSMFTRTRSSSSKLSEKKKKIKRFINLAAMVCATWPSIYVLYAPQHHHPHLPVVQGFLHLLLWLGIASFFFFFFSFKQKKECFACRHHQSHHIIHPSFIQTLKKNQK